MFDFPPSSIVDRLIAKTKLLENANASPRIKKLLTDQVKQLRWHAKLSPSTIKLTATPAVPEIQIFHIILKSNNISPDLLDWIDKAIPQPIFFIIHSPQDQTAHSASYKRPSEADASQWVTGSRFTTPFTTAAETLPLPTALDLSYLYAAIFARLLPLPPREKEPLPTHIERCNSYLTLQLQISQLSSKIRREKQFNRKVLLNQELHSLKDQIRKLTHSPL